MTHNPAIYLVGEDNPYGSDPKYALYPLPDRSAGNRLCEMVLGLGMRDYLDPDIFARRNLCSGRWNKEEAERTAGNILEEARNAGKSVVVVMLGKKVSDAFRSNCGEFEAQGSLFDRVVLLRLPHPSGRCRTWNKPGSFEHARGVLAKVAPEYKALLEAEAIRREGSREKSVRHRAAHAVRRQERAAQRATQWHPVQRPTTPGAGGQHRLPRGARKMVDRRPRAAPEGRKGRRGRDEAKGWQMSDNVTDAELKGFEDDNSAFWEGITDTDDVISFARRCVKTIRKLRTSLKSARKAKSATKQRLEKTLKAYADARQTLDKMSKLHPRDTYHEDYGSVLWWMLPIEEPPFVGRSPDEDDDVPTYVTHWQWMLVPTDVVEK